MLPHFWFFAGKGGVGKTTLAAAAAVHMARQGQRVMITSTDPAHSLSDVFDRPIGDRGLAVEKNLFAMEVDSSARWSQATSRTEQPKSRTQRAFLDAVELLGEAPGVDEFMSLELLLEAMSTKEYDQIVFDTAPTGHTLRLMSLPRMLDGWLGRLLTLKGMFSKIGRAVRKLVPGEPADDLGADLGFARDRLVEAIALLRDPARTDFALVTIPEALSVLETSRTLVQLARQGITVTAIYANQVQPPSETCAHCRMRAAIHEAELTRLRTVAVGFPLYAVLARPSILRGPDTLAVLGKEIWG